MVARVARDALLTKYSLLPLLYTLFFVHSTAGETVVRPLWHEFPTDSKTRDIDTQVRSWSCLIPFFLLSSFGEVPSLSPQSWSRVLRNGRTTLKKRNILNHCHHQVSLPSEFSDMVRLLHRTKSDRRRGEQIMMIFVIHEQ